MVFYFDKRHLTDNLKTVIDDLGGLITDVLEFKNVVLIEIPEPICTSDAIQLKNVLGSIFKCYGTPNINDKPCIRNVYAPDFNTGNGKNFDQTEYKRLFVRSAMAENLQMLCYRIPYENEIQSFNNLDNIICNIADGDDLTSIVQRHELEKNIPVILFADVYYYASDVHFSFDYYIETELEYGYSLHTLKTIVSEMYQSVADAVRNGHGLYLSHHSLFFDLESYYRISLDDLYQRTDLKEKDIQLLVLTPATEGQYVPITILASKASKKVKVYNISTAGAYIGKGGSNIKALNKRYNKHIQFV